MATLATATVDPLVTTLIALLGPAAVLTDDESCDFYTQDVFTRGPRARAVIRPTDTASLAAAVAAVTGAGVAIVPRGGGMSYTSGYVPPKAGAVLVDMGGMDRVLAIDPVAMTVTVEAGCTWAALYEALRPHKLRPPMWGTLSGLKATVGGGMSQNGLFWGSGRHGTAVESALGFEVVLASGEVIDTGTFMRPYGPDLTGLFAADAGALGIKATVTLRLIPEAEHFAFASFSFPDATALFATLSEVGRQGLASEAFGFDPYLQSRRVLRESLGKDAKALIGVMKAQGSILGALKEGARIVAAGRSFLDGVPYSAHFTTEGRTATRVAEDIAAIGAIAARNGGSEVENTIPKVLRANPFGPVNSMLGPEGERWVPIHGLLTHAAAGPTLAKIEALYAEHAAEMERLGVATGYMFATSGATAVLIEPVFFWPDATEALHRAAVEPAHLARLKTYAPNPPARALVETLRAAIVGIFREMGAVHLQIGRTYPWAESLSPPARQLATRLKHAVDPRGLMNPGSLGL